MFCINCSHATTSVGNTRPSKKLPTVWRRRTCTRCGYVFTTDEFPRFSDIVVETPSGDNYPLNPGVLVLSIAKAFQHDSEKGALNAWELAQTVIMKLFTEEPQKITSERISRLAYETIQAYDEIAGMQYGLTHGIVTSLKRRGRPSFGAAAASHDPETQA